MKNILVACIVCFFFIPDLLAQTVDNNNSYTVNAYDINGKVLTNKTTDVLGTPLLNDEWGKGKVKFKTGQFITNLELQYNLAENELYFKKDNITYAFVDPIEEFELSYQFENEKRFSTFRCGYPLSGENTRTTFYEVIIDGKNLQLLRKTMKLIQTKANYGQSAQKEYKDMVQWYIYDAQQSVVNKIKKDLRSIKEALPAYSDKIEKFRKDSNNKFHSDAEISALIVFLNS